MLRAHIPPLLAAMLALAGCAGPQTTRMSAADLEMVHADMESQFHQSAFLAERTPDSPRAVLRIATFTNLSSDLMDREEKWQMLQFVWPESIRREKNVALTMGVDEAREIRQSGAIEAAFTERPTHILHAVLRGVTRSQGEHRTDLYRFEYRIVELPSGAREWTGAVEFKRSAAGPSWN